MHSVLNGYDVLKVLTILLKYVLLSAITHFLRIFQIVNFSVQNFDGGVDGSGILVEFLNNSALNFSNCNYGVI